MNPFRKLKFLRSPKASPPSDSAPPRSDAVLPPSDAGTPPSGAAQTPRVQSIQRPRPTGYLRGQPNLLRNLWALHPDRTTRRLRRLLVSWEKLGYFLGFSGSPLKVCAGTENSFLKAKVAVAHSAGFLRFIEGMGNVGREAHEKETEFIRILERCPSLYVVSTATWEARRELFYSWHSLYLFLHRVLGACPYEISAQTTPFPVVVPGQVERAAKKVGSLGERRMA